MVQVSKKVLKFFENYFVEKCKSFANKQEEYKGESNNTINVTNVIEEKIVVFIASAKILEHEGSISPSSF